MIAGTYFGIDAHCHIYPQKIAALAVDHTNHFYNERSTGAGTVEDLLYAEQSDLDFFVVQSVATTPKQVDSINRFIAQEVSLHPDKLIGLGTMHPDSTDMELQLDQAMALGLKGIKLHPDMQQFPINDPRCYPLYAMCQERGLVLLLHTGDKRYNFSNPEQLIPVLKDFPRLTVIGAHLGGWSIWDTAWKSLRDFPNLCVDCSSSFHYLTPEAAREAILAYGTHRVLFGTDYPMWHAKPEIDYLLGLGLSQQDYRQIFAEIAIRVFGIPLSV